MTNVKAQSSNEFQSSNKKYFDIYSFGIDLAFELWHLKFYSAEGLGKRRQSDGGDFCTGRASAR